jgi:hypothetical protein
MLVNLRVVLKSAGKVIFTIVLKFEVLMVQASGMCHHDFGRTCFSIFRVEDLTEDGCSSFLQ